MIRCPRCGASFEDAALNFCGKCGSDMRGPERSPAQGIGGAAVAEAVPEIGPGETQDPLLGAVLDGRYRVLSRLGAGGMGAVYKVEHVAMGKVAALKMLHPTLSTDREVVKRFRREAQAVSLLTHPNTVQVFDFGQSQGCLYMVMEYVRGEDLAAIVRRDGQLAWDKAAPLLAQVCDALSEAHEAGIIHRDLKPENILVTRGRDGRDVAKVLDFGLAKLRQMEQLDGATARGSVIGTPYYMSPEQIRAEEPDARSDIYSVGAMIYRVLTGEPPFAGPTPLVVLSAHLSDPLVPMAERRKDLSFDPRVEALVARCLEKDRDKRFATIEEVRRAIEEARGPDRSPLPKPAPPQPTTTGVHDRRDPTSGRAGTVPVARREDFDQFERSLKWRRFFALSLVPLVLGGLGVGGWYWFRHADGRVPVDVEVESNNTAAAANDIASNRTVRGHIGQRIDVENSDRDFFHFHVDKGPALGRLELTGIPNMDLHLALFDGNGGRLAEADGDGAGAGEVIPNQRLETGDYYVEVREVWTVGHQATENMSDWYTLNARWRGLKPGEEAEPDDTPAQALDAHLDEPMRGYLGRAFDVDWFVPRGASGGAGVKLEGSVSGIEGVDLRVVVVPAGVTVGEDFLKPLHAGDKPAPLPSGVLVFDAAGPGQGEHFSAPWSETAPPFVVVARKDKPIAADGHHPPAVGVDVPYSLTLTRAPKP